MRSRIESKHIYVFVILNKADAPVEYFIVSGNKLRENPENFGKDFDHPTFPGILPRYLEEFRNNWDVFNG